MSKKLKVLIAVLVAIITLTVSGTMAVLAQDDAEPEPEEAESAQELDEIVPGAGLFRAAIGSGELFSRVAGILGISEEELRDAIEEARQDIIAERGEKAFDQLLDKAVAEDLISEEEAQEIREWWQEKPEALDWALLQKAFNIMRQRSGPMANSGWEGFKGIKRGVQQQLKNSNKPAALSQMSPQPQIMKAIARSADDCRPGRVAGAAAIPESGLGL